MSIPKIELMKGYDVVPNNSPIDNPRTFQASSVQELLDATLTPTKVITSWGFGKTLRLRFWPAFKARQRDIINHRYPLSPTSRWLTE